LSRSTINSTSTQTKFTASDIEENNLFFEAQRLKVLNDNKGTIDAFEKVIAFNPKNHASMFELARLYYAKQEDEKALKNISNAIKFEPNNLWYNLVYAQILTVKENYKEAVLIYNKILELEPREQAYYYDKAGLLENTGDINKTIDFYNEIEKIFGVDEYEIDQKKRLYLSINKIDKAAQELEKLINYDSTNVNYYNYLASLYASNKMPERSIPIYNYILEKFPDNYQALLALADEAYQKGDKNKAIEYTTRAFNNNAMNIDLKIKILNQYIQFYKWKKEEILDAYKLAIALRNTHPNDAKSYAISGDLYYTGGFDSAALYYYIKSLDYKKDIYSVWQQSMQLMSEMRKFDLLKKYSEEAIDYFPSQALPYYFNGIAMYQFKRYRDATNVLNEALKLSSDNKTLKAQVYSLLGDNYHEIGNDTYSDSCYEEALKIDSKNAYALNNYAYFLSLRKDKLTKAKEYAQMAITLERFNSNYLDTYAWILFQLGEYTKAEEYQLSAIRNSDLSDPVLFDHYGDILYKNNKIEDAVLAWKKAKEKGLVSKVIDKKINDKKWYEDTP
jgi:tetratricopeptide (TPR) repeat protein